MSDAFGIVFVAFGLWLLVRFREVARWNSDNMIIQFSAERMRWINRCGCVFNFAGSLCAIYYGLRILGA
jgi:hypothetical protein